MTFLLKKNRIAMFVLFFLVGGSAQAENTNITPVDARMCDMDQGKCLRMANHYLISGKSEYGLEILKYRANGGEVTDIYNYAINLKKVGRPSWLELMRIAAGLGDSEAQLELANFYFLSSKTKSKMELKFEDYLFATFEEDGEQACAEMMVMSNKLNENISTLFALRRNFTFCQTKLGNSIAGREMLKLQALMEKKLSALALVAWGKYKLRISK